MFKLTGQIIVFVLAFKFSRHVKSWLNGFWYAHN